MVKGVVLSSNTQGKSLMLFTPEVSWMQSTRRLKSLGLRSPPRWRVSLLKSWTQWTQLVILDLCTFLFYPLTRSFSNVGVLCYCSGQTKRRTRRLCWSWLDCSRTILKPSLTTRLARATTIWQKRFSQLVQSFETIMCGWECRMVGKKNVALEYYGSFGWFRWTFHSSLSKKCSLHSSLHSQFSSFFHLLKLLTYSVANCFLLHHTTILVATRIIMPTGPRQLRSILMSIN